MVWWDVTYVLWLSHMVGAWALGASGTLGEATENRGVKTVGENSGASDARERVGERYAMSRVVSTVRAVPTLSLTTSSGMSLPVRR